LEKAHYVTYSEQYSTLFSAASVCSATDWVPFSWKPVLSRFCSGEFFEPNLESSLSIKRDSKDRVHVRFGSTGETLGAKEEFVQKSHFPFQAQATLF
jgi:hypothetical protein